MAVHLQYAPSIQANQITPKRIIIKIQIVVYFCVVSMADIKSQHKLLGQTFINIFSKNKLLTSWWLKFKSLLAFPYHRTSVLAPTTKWAPTFLNPQHFGSQNLLTSRNCCQQKLLTPHNYCPNILLAPQTYYPRNVWPPTIVVPQNCWSAEICFNPTLASIMIPADGRGGGNYFLMVDFLVFHDTTLYTYIAPCKIQKIWVLG